MTKQQARRAGLWGLALATTLALAATGITGDARADSQESDSASAAQPETREVADARTTPVPIFVPRDRGAPSTRVGGATRGPGVADVPSIDALVPEQPGYTMHAQPRLYWHLSDATDIRVDFVVLDSNGEALVDTTLPGPFAGGVQVIDLGDHGITLEPGAIHTWYVSLVPDPDSRSKDRVTGGSVELLEPDEGLRAELAGASPDRAAFALAGAGMWYDALTVLTERIAASPDGPARFQRAALLEQVGLQGPASADRAALAAVR